MAEVGMQHNAPQEAVSWVALACTIVALGCGDNATGPDPDIPDVTNDPVTVSVVSSVDVVMAVGRTAQMNATVTAAGGTVVSGATVSWRSSNDQVAAVSGSGVVTGLQEGQVTITATHSGVSGSTPLTIIDADLEGIAELRNDPLMQLLVEQLSDDLSRQLSDALSSFDDAVTIGNCLAIRDALQAALSGTSASPNPSDVVTLAVIGLVLERAQGLLGMN
jgi:uncharacterized protein YjdB